MTDIGHHSAVEPAELLGALLKDIPYAIAVFDTAMHYIACSQRWLDDYHLPAQTITGLSHYEVFPEISDEWKQIHAECLAGAVHERSDDPFPRQDGSVDYVSWKIVPWHHKSGEVAGIIMYTSVSTAQVIAERKNRHYERELQTLLEKTRAVPWRIDLDTGRFTYIGPQVEPLLGYPAASWLDLATWTSRIHPDDRERAVEYRREKIRQGQDYDFVYRIISLDGKSVWVRDAVSYIPGKEEGVGHAALAGLFIDVSEQQTIETKLRNSEEQYRSVIELSGDGFWLTDMSGTLIEVNDAYATLSGYSKEELVGMHISDLEAKEEPEETARHINEIINKGNALFESRHRKKNGEIWDVEISTSFSRSQGGRFFVFIRDITERKRTQEEMRLITQVYRNTGEGIVITDPEGLIVDVNNAYCNITGYSREEMIGAKPNKVKSDRHDAEFYRSMWQSIIEKGYWVGEIWDRRKNGEVFPKWLNINAVHDDEGNLTHYVGIFSDISVLKGIERELEHMAYYDALTELPNRLLFRDRMESEISRHGRYGGRCAVLFLDIDRFKLINDTLGHSAGDELLIEVSRRIKKILRESDTVARMGGDEFTLLLPRIKSSDTIAVVAQNLMDAIKEPFTLQGEELRVGSSIGIAIYPDDGTNYITLTRHADAAMYEAKAAGRGQYRFFSAYMDKSAHEHLSIERDLHRAVEEEQFFLVFQPQVNAHSKRIASCEALIRWYHPEKGIIPPDKFIPVAEESGLIYAIGEWVIRESCRQITEWQKQIDVAPVVAINLSARQFRQEKLVERIIDIVDDYNVDVANIEFEITESAAMENAETTLERLSALAQKGFSIAIDDFGTGYSSLSYLKIFPVNKLKLDRSFVMDIPSDENDAAISSAVINMANSLGLKVVAEGVETAEQRDFLMSHGCSIMQGYFYSKPLSPDDFVNYVKKY